MDVFFVISGFVITAPLTRRPARSLGDLLLDFFSLRLKRLVPALLLLVVVSGVLACLVIPRPHTALRTGISALFGFSNIYLHGQATDSFGTATKLNPFTHIWSLGVEGQFYLLFPVVAWLTGFARFSDHLRSALSRPAGVVWPAVVRGLGRLPPLAPALGLVGVGRFSNGTSSPIRRSRRCVLPPRRSAGC